MKHKRVLLIAGVALALIVVFALGVLAGSRTAPAAAGAAESKSAAQAEPESAEHGVVVVSLDPDGPAAQAGVKRGDILLSSGDAEVNSPRDLVAALADREPGDQVSLTVLHGDERRSLTATLGERNGRAYLGLTPCGGHLGILPFEDIIEGFTAEAQRGVIVVEVVEDGPAAKAGIEAGALIVAVDGQELNAQNDLAGALAGHKPGDSVTLTVEDANGESREVTVTLGEHPDEEGKAYLGVMYQPAMPHVRMFPGDVMPFLPRGDKGMPFGFALPDIEGLQGGAIVVQVAEDSPAAEAGLQKGDVITAIDGEPVDSPDAVREAVAAKKPGDTLALTVQRPGEAEEMEITATLGEHPEEAGKAYLGVHIGGFFMSFRSDQAPGDLKRFMPRFNFQWPFGEDFQWPFPPVEPEQAPDGSTTL
jgi:S1-C subfamily serine protease